MTEEPWLRIELGATENAPFTVMFEPSGMSYELGPTDRMFADVLAPHTNKFVIEHWERGISIWAPGGVVTRTVNGSELHRLN